MPEKPIDIDYIEKVKIPEYESYGWTNACKEMRALIAEIRRLRSERSDKAAAMTTGDEKS